MGVNGKDLKKRVFERILKRNQSTGMNRSILRRNKLNKKLIKISTYEYNNMIMSIVIYAWETELLNKTEKEILEEVGRENHYFS